MRKDVVQGRKRKQASSGRRRRRDQKSRGIVQFLLLCFVLSFELVDEMACHSLMLSIQCLPGPFYSWSVGIKKIFETA